MGFARIVVQPYFLFDGILLKRIYEAAARQATANSSVDFVTTSHFRLHPLMLQAFEERAHEALHGTPHMNCDLCKYRVRLIGREEDLGAPQVGHHHHVRATDGRHERLVSRTRQDATPSAADRDTEFHPWDERLLRRLSLIN
jgi:sirohydrochlorin cobaltochelatase